MAKQCMIQRELKRQKLVTKYSGKRAKLLLDLKNSNSLTDIFSVQNKLQRLPNNSAPIRLKNRCWKTAQNSTTNNQIPSIAGVSASVTN